MKRNTLIVAVLTLISLYATAQNRQQSIERFRLLQEHGYMFGHQDDPFYGVHWKWGPNRSDVKETCGDYPAVMGFDLGGIEVGDEKNLDSIPFTRMREEILAHIERGGIVTLSWHPRNPLTGGTAWDVSDKSTVRSILPGGDQHLKFLGWMRNVTRFISSLRVEYGKPVPIIFRPWHENNGSWFWWGEQNCTQEEFHALWCMLQDYMLHNGMENIVWSYSPNYSARLTEEEFLKRYPGNDRVDIIGLDAYQWTVAEEDAFVKQLNDNLTVLCNYAADNDKLVALTECGMKKLDDPTWWTRVLKKQLDKYPILYFLVWRNAGTHEYYGPVPDTNNGKYFNKLYNADNTLFLNDIVNITQ